VVPVLSDVSEERIASIFRAGGEHGITVKHVPEPHGATPQKKIFCIVTAVKTSNLTYYYKVHNTYVKVLYYELSNSSF
jgi:hypothetical protein